MEGNELTELNKKLFLALRKLKWLDVRNNKLTTIPTTIVEHPSLQVLLLEGNHIETLPTEIGELILPTFYKNITFYNLGRTQGIKEVDSPLCEKEAVGRI